MSFDFLYSSIILNNQTLIKKADQGKAYVVLPSEYAHTIAWKLALSGVQKFYREGQKDIKIKNYFALVLLMTAQQEELVEKLTNK